MGRRGTKPTWVKVGGCDVEGLYEDKTNKVYYWFEEDPVTGKLKKNSRTNKSQAALALYRYNLKKQAQKTTKVFFDTEDDENGNFITKASSEDAYVVGAEIPKQEQVIYKGKEGNEVTLRTYDTFHIPDNFIIERFVEMLDSNPRQMAESFINMGREDLAGIIHLPKNFTLPRTKLTDMLKWYFDYEERSPDTQKKVVPHFNEFCDIVNVDYMEQLTNEHIKAYRQRIIDLKKRGFHTKTFLRHRFDAVKRIFRHAKLHIENKAELNNKIDALESILSVDGEGETKNAKPIEVNQMQWLLRATAQKPKNRVEKLRLAKWKAILLTALNTCSYMKDLCDMTLTQTNSIVGVDLKAGTLSMYRVKTSIAKVAVLWQETIEAILQYRELRDTDSVHLFVSRNNSPCLRSHLRKEWSKYIKPLASKIASEETGEKINLSFLEFSMIRDGCFTACAKAHLPIDQRNFVSGHKNLGTDDDYLLRQPELAKPACDAIYSYFIAQNLQNKDE